jgi:alpha-L-fucosidase
MEISNIAENIFSMAEIAKEYGIEIYICSVLPAKDFPWSPNIEPAKKVIKLNNVLKEYCLKNNIVYVDYYSKMEDGRGGLKVPEYTSAVDLVHPNSDGYAVMESIILKAIKL